MIQKLKGRIVRGRKSKKPCWVLIKQEEDEKK